MNKNKKIILISSIVAIVVFLVSILVLLILKYNVEGEKNIPFEITSIRIVSTASGIDTEDSENKWNINVIQTNDFYLYIEKNKNYSKDDSISKITVSNFNIEKKSDIGTINMYKPSTNYILFNYSDDYKFENEISYTGALNSNLASLEISNQGGLIGFSVALQDLGAYISNESENIVQDGTLLSKIGLNTDDVKIKISFDVIIETNSKNKFKTKLDFDLPIGNITEEGKAIYNKDSFNDVIYKRIK